MSVRLSYYFIVAAVALYFPFSFIGQQMFNFLNVDLAGTLIAYVVTVMLVQLFISNKATDALRDDQIKFRTFLFIIGGTSFITTLPWIWALIEDWKTTILISLALTPLGVVFSKVTSHRLI